SAVVVAAGLTRPPRGTSAAHGPRGPASASSEIEPLAGEPNTRASVPEELPPPASSSSASASSSARAPRAGARLPPRASPDEPGKKPPRPNPYASAPAPR
ncbi:MAG TPA: hypothetical protein VLT33_27335, partial [Labilithrix sp.]|nr:hypothetical protein [Labilithrix sp.]